MDRNLLYFVIALCLFIFVVVPTSCCLYRCITTKEYQQKKNNYSNVKYSETNPLLDV
jgi:hypothetical protein